MVKNWKAAIGAAVLSVSMFGAGAISTSAVHAQALPALRGERGSAHNILSIKTRLERLIDQLQRDRRDYGGHREAAIDDLQKARVQLEAAVNYDATHGR